MIISKIIGGLGNQLFQYAAAKALAVHHTTQLKLDVSGFDSYKLRNFELDAFNVSYEKASEQEIASFSNRTFLKKVTDRIGPYSGRTFFREKFFHFHKGFLKYPSNTYLKGYWQSEKYFLPIENIIRQEFTLKPNFIQNVKDYGETIKINETVALHIRRGDYANKETLTLHGIIPLSYYKEAVHLMQQKSPNIHLLIFSDDINWAKENLHFPNMVFVSNDMTKTAFEDLYLMSHCKHNIIANSSFSWWGAWLNNNPEKIVIAPKNWFNQGPKDTYDIYPKGWIKL
ncbi:MAG: alpha-1,2-fucosyltransferase [Bacteroidetes bacterium]|nr:alpha-1,2-fucosyltransferase [Bacteroidota bacterium]